MEQPLLKTREAFHRSAVSFQIHLHPLNAQLYTIRYDITRSVKFLFEKQQFQMHPNPL